MTKKHKYSKLNNIYFRLILSVILWIILIGVIFIPPLRETIHPIMIRFTSNSLVFWANILNIPVFVPEYPMIDIFHFQMQIVFEHTAFNFLLFAFALVVFSLWSLKTKFINFLIYIAVIYFLNLMRFIFMGWIGHIDPELFENIHNYFWNILFALVVLLMWVITYEKSGKPKDVQNQESYPG